MCHLYKFISFRISSIYLWVKSCPHVLGKYICDMCFLSYTSLFYIVWYVLHVDVLYNWCIDCCPSWCCNSLSLIMSCVYEQFVWHWHVCYDWWSDKTCVVVNVCSSCIVPLLLTWWERIDMLDECCILSWIVYMFMIWYEFCCYMYFFQYFYHLHRLLVRIIRRYMWTITIT